MDFSYYFCSMMHCNTLKKGIATCFELKISQKKSMKILAIWLPLITSSWFLVLEVWSDYKWNFKPLQSRSMTYQTIKLKYSGGIISPSSGISWTAEIINFLLYWHLSLGTLRRILSLAFVGSVHEWAGLSSLTYFFLNVYVEVSDPWFIWNY